MSDPPDADREAFERDARELRELFVASRRADLERLGPAIAAGDFAAVRAVGHVFKGSGATFGFPEAGRLGERLEAAAEAVDAAAARGIACELAALLAPRP